jgi:hypothetical protein
VDRRRAAGRRSGGPYTSQVRDEAIAELARAARLKAGFFRPAFTGLMMRALMESGAIRAVMADLVAGRQSYASLKWRLLKTFELGSRGGARDGLELRTRTQNSADSNANGDTTSDYERLATKYRPRRR